MVQPSRVKNAQVGADGGRDAFPPGKSRDEIALIVAELGQELGAWMPAASPSPLAGEVIEELTPDDVIDDHELDDLDLDVHDFDDLITMENAVPRRFAALGRIVARPQAC